MSSSTVRMLVLAAATAVGAGACITGTIHDNEEGAKPTTSSSGSGAASGSGGATATTTVGSGGSDPGCASPDECPGLDMACRYRTCTDGVCDFENAAADTPCSEGDATLCDGMGKCVECLDNPDCAQPAVCQNNQCVPATCLDNMQNGDETDVDCGGSCSPCGNSLGCMSAIDCLSGFCNNGTCHPCGSDNDCGSGQWCNAGTCAPDKVNGDVCSAPNQCASGNCPGQDGVCCQSACNGGCVACVSGKTGLANGTCGPVNASTDPDAECGAQGASTCDANGTGCNGSSQSPGCNLYPSGTVCVNPSCSSGQQTAAGICNGSGTCNVGSTTACNPYVCSGNACLTNCLMGGNADCASGYVCSSGNCVPQQTGGPCTTPSQCTSGYCVDGYCCNTACTGACRACDVGSSLGTCTFIAVNTDPDNECAGTDVCDGAGQCGPQCLGAGPNTTPLDTEEQALLVLINNHRANNGAGPLSACTSLNRAAQGHSEDMRDQNYFSHTGLNGSSPWDRACWACYDHGCGPTTAMAENIAAGNSGAQATFTQWVNSPGHNANMLNPNFVKIGIGRATGGGTYGSYWTNVFGGITEPSCN